MVGKIGNERVSKQRRIPKIPSLLPPSVYLKKQPDAQRNRGKGKAECRKEPADPIGKTCHIVTFTNALNGADKYVNVLDNGALEFKCPEGLDFFIDPNEGKLTNITLPALLTKVDNTKPFTFTAKVTPEFTPDGLYNAADLLVYANDSLWQKLCFEQDEYGSHRIVSVRTDGTSDDNNHDKLDVKSVFLKISSDTRTIASYYSIDNNEWHMVRLYKNYYPDSLYVGVSSQCPKHGSCTSLIEDVTLNVDNVKDFRMGK